MDFKAQAAQTVWDGIHFQLLPFALHEKPNRGFRMGLDGFADGFEIRQAHVAHRQDAVPSLQAGDVGTAGGIHVQNFAGIQQGKRTTDALVDEDLAQLLVQIEGNFLPVAQQVHLGHTAVEALHAEVAVVRQSLPVVSQDAVPILEPELLQGRIDIDRVDVGQFGLAPGVQHTGVDDEAKDEVDNDAAEHDDQTLPCGL